MDLPSLPPLPDAVLTAVAARFGATRIVPLERAGIFNAMFALDDRLLLRVPRDHPAFIAALVKEPRAVAAARAAGVRTPQIIAYDDSRDLLPVPFAVYERVDGTDLAARFPDDPADADHAWRAAGTDLGRLHRGVDPTALADLVSEELPAAQQMARHLPEQGVCGPAEAEWLAGWLDRLDGLTGPAPAVFVHGDLQSSHLMLDAAGDYLALVDWGGCGVGDPANDFAGVPMRAVPAMLSGYLDGAGLTDDVVAALAARIVRRQLAIALFLLSRPPQPGLSWAERPAGALLDMLRFFAGRPGGGPIDWAALAPGA
jgi:aminoglycoside phosphotransferase (APT) family kinase protein